MQRVEGAELGQAEVATALDIAGSALSVCTTALNDSLNRCESWERYRRNRAALGLTRLLEEAIEGISIERSNAAVWTYIKQAVLERAQKDAAAMATSEVAVAK